MKGDKKTLFDYVFWIAFIFFTNPGGILEGLGQDIEGGGTLKYEDFLFVILVGCFVMKFKIVGKESDKTFNKVKKYILICFIFHLITYGFFTPILRNSSEYTPVFFIIKNRWAFMNVALFIMVYKFYVRSYQIFFKVFIYSTIIIIPLFIVSVVTGLEILPVIDYNRRFTTLPRKFMHEYGLMPFLIPLGAILLVFKFGVKYRKHFIAGFILLFLSYILSITRRFIFGTFIVLFLGLVFNSFILRKPLFSFNGIIKTLIFSTVIFYGINLTFPKYVEAGVQAYEETVSVFETGKTSSGKKDERLGFNRTFIVNFIKKYPYFGTGFDNRWRTSDGDKQGFEAADYPLLAAIAMTGFFGILFFLPVYIVLVRALIYDIKFLRRYKYKRTSFEQYVLISFILFFIYDLLQYVNWFYMLSNSSDGNWYFALTLYLASRHVYYHNNKLQLK